MARSKELYEFDIETEKWSIRDEGYIGIEGHGSVLYEDSLLSFGGFTD